MFARTVRVAATLALAASAACHENASPPPFDGKLKLGESYSVGGATSFTLDPDSTNGEYVAVVVNNGLLAGQKESYSLRGDGLVAPAPSLLPADAPRLSIAASSAAPSGPVLDQRFESKLRESERTELTPLIPAARAWMAARSPAATTLGQYSLSRSNIAIPSTVKVGDTISVNVNGTDACANAVMHRARVAAIGTHAIVLDDVNNPRPGFTDLDYARYAANFDTLVWNVDVNAFGAPTDIDNNGHVGLLFTLAVNQLTPANANYYIMGFHYSRDLFPRTTQGRLQGCATSNEGELFYLMAPDPTGIYGNRRSTAFVDSNTTAVLAHEFQHLINNSRRLYVNNAAALEARWLDEGLAHAAEELLFYREAGLTPRMNLDSLQIRASARARTAFNLDMFANASRYQSYIKRPSTASPYANDDSLQTRGATWDLLRYLVDRNGTSDGDQFYRIVNSADTGTVNLRGVFGGGFAGLVRDWAVSNAVDDTVLTQADLQQPSWNWHSVMVALNRAPFPLPIATMTNGTSVSGNVTAGGAAYFRLAVPARAPATISLSQASAGGNLQLVVVRVK